jgi:ABC-type multidrug transport system fused ATPase/permease subunit
LILGTTLPLLDMFFTILWFFLFVIWIWIVIMILIDIFRSHDINGLIKALWLVFILIFPLIGVVAYLLVRGGSMHERASRDAARSQQQFDSYIRQTAGKSTSDELANLAALRQSGAITEEEFERAKAKVLS